MNATEIVKNILEGDFDEFDPLDYVKSARNRESAVEIYNGPLVRVIQPLAAFTINNYLPDNAAWDDTYFKAIEKSGPIYLAVDKADHDNIAIFQPSSGNAWNGEGKQVDFKELAHLISTPGPASKYGEAKNPQEDKNWLDLQQGLATFFMAQIAKKKNVGQWVKYLTMIGRTDLATNYARYLGRAKLPLGKSIDAVMAMKKAGKRSRNRIARLMKSQENVKWGEQGFWLLFNDWADLAPFYDSDDYKANAEKIFSGDTTEWFDNAETKPEEVWDAINDKNMSVIKQLLVNRTVYNSDGEEHRVTRDNVGELDTDEIKDIVCDRGNKGGSCADIADAIRWAAADAYQSNMENAYYEGYQHALMSAWGLKEDKTIKWIKVGKPAPDKKLEGGGVEKGAQKQMLGIYFPYSTLEEWIAKWKEDEYEDDYYGDIHDLAAAYLEKVRPNESYSDSSDDDDYFNGQLDYHLSELDLTPAPNQKDPGQPELPLEGEPPAEGGEIEKPYTVMVGEHPNQNVYKGIPKGEATKYREAMKPNRDDITFRAESFLAHPLNRIEERAGDIKIEFEASDEAAESLVPLLKELKKMGSQGSSRNIKIDDWDGRSSFGFDGDGASKIGEIKVDGQVVEKLLESDDQIDPKAFLNVNNAALTTGYLVRSPEKDGRVLYFGNGAETPFSEDVEQASVMGREEADRLCGELNQHFPDYSYEVIPDFRAQPGQSIASEAVQEDIDPKDFVKRIKENYVITQTFTDGAGQPFTHWLLFPVENQFEMERFGSFDRAWRWKKYDDALRTLRCLEDQGRRGFEIVQIYDKLLPELLHLQDHKIRPVFDDPFPVKESVLQEAVYKRSTTQIDLPKEIGGHIIQWGELNIAEDDLYIDEKDGCGRETEQHVTVLYGLTDSTPSPELTEIVESTKPFLIEFAGVSIFENEKYDVIKLSVVSEELHNLHSQIRKACPNENKFPDYIPHCTIAYVKKGKGKKYEGQDVFKSAQVPRDFWAYDLLFKGAGDSEDGERVVQLIHFDKSKSIEEPDEPEAGDQRYPQATEGESELAVAESLDPKAFLDRNVPMDCPECHSTNLSEPDEEGLVDCGECGILFDPFHPANKPVAESGIDAKKFTERPGTNVDPHPDWKLVDRKQDQHGRVATAYEHRNGRCSFKLISDFFEHNSPTALDRWSVYVYDSHGEFIDGEDFQAESFREAETTATNIAFTLIHSTSPSLFDPADTRTRQRQESEEVDPKALAMRVPPPAPPQPIGRKNNLPVYTGKDAYRWLFQQYGIPNSIPISGRTPFGRSDALFVDDEQDGKPVAIWVHEVVNEAEEINAKEFLARTTQYRIRYGVGAATRYLHKEGEALFWKDDYDTAALFNSDEAGEMIDRIGDPYGGQPVTAELVDDSSYQDNHLGENIDPKSFIAKIPHHELQHWDEAGPEGGYQCSCGQWRYKLTGWSNSIPQAMREFRAHKRVETAKAKNVKMGESDEVDPKVFALRTPTDYVIKRYTDSMDASQVAYWSGAGMVFYRDINDAHIMSETEANAVYKRMIYANYSPNELQVVCVKRGTVRGNLNFTEALNGPFDDDGLPGEVTAFLRLQRGRARKARKAQTGRSVL